MKNNLVVGVVFVYMFQHISETDEVRQDPAECEERFNSLENGDVVTLIAWGGGDEYVKAEFEVSRVNQDTSPADDYVYGQIDGTSAKLCLPWRPAEPNVGIPQAYSEGPIQFEYEEDTYDVSSLQIE